MRSKLVLDEALLSKLAVDVPGHAFSLSLRCRNLIFERGASHELFLSRFALFLLGKFIYLYLLLLIFPIKL